MKFYEATDEDDFMISLIQTIEKETDKKIFTIKVLDDCLDGFEALIVFEDKTILKGKISVGTYQGINAIRMQGNFM